ncbi:MAG: DciA family protein [Hyphomicrobiales bacterium]|nr:DciA family protein [Alphaproteobacteria bacterium]
MNKYRPVRKLAELTSEFMADAFKKQGFAATELVTRWKDIAGPEIAAHTEPVKLQWPREVNGEPAEPATLVLRVEGPVAIEIQHQSAIILERINRFFGWQAVGRIVLRQAPLTRPKARAVPPKLDAAEVARVEATLTAVADDGLRAALGRLGAAVKRR